MIVGPCPVRGHPPPQQTRALGFIVLENTTTYGMLESGVEFAVNARNGQFVLGASSEAEAFAWLVGTPVRPRSLCCGLAYA